MTHMKSVTMRTRYLCAILAASCYSLCGCAREDMADENRGIAARATSALESSALPSRHPEAILDVVVPDPGNARPPPARVVIDVSPDAKRSRTDWPDLLAAKNRLKADIAREPAKALVPPPRPTDFQIAQQKAFLQAARDAGFEALSLEDRERAYSELKRRMLGE